MDHSPLNNLATELRNRIYHFALVEHEPSAVLVYRHEYTARLSDADITDKKHRLSLLATCRQIRSESLTIFFSANRFTIRTADEEDEDDEEGEEGEDINHFISAALCWVGHLGPLAAFLRFLEIDLGDFVDVYDERPIATALKAFKYGFNWPRLELALTATQSFEFYGKTYDFTVDFNGNCGTGAVMHSLEQEVCEFNVSLVLDPQYRFEDEDSEDALDECWNMQVNSRRLLIS